MSFFYSLLAKKFLPNYNVGSEDPYYETDISNGDHKKRKRRPIPDNLSPNDAKILKTFRKKAYRLDLALECCCGIQVGWAGIIQIIPWIGDIWACFLAYRLIVLAQRIDGGLPTDLHQKMMANVIFDFTVGLIPIVGDLINIAYKCNSRNVLALEHYLIKKSGGRPQEQIAMTTTTTAVNNQPRQQIVQHQVASEPVAPPLTNTNNRSQSGVY